jgi:hypothetical protein
MPELLKSHTVQLSSIIISLSLALSLPEVQAILPSDSLKYVTAIVALGAIFRKSIQEK